MKIGTTTAYYIKAVNGGYGNDYKLIPKIVSFRHFFRYQKHHYLYLGYHVTSDDAEKYAINAGYIVKNQKYNAYNSRLFFTEKGINEFIIKEV